MHTLFILNDPPYGNERCYNALRLADAVGAARAGQKTPDGYYNLERMLKRVVRGKGTVILCGTCMDARGMTEEDLLEGTRRGTMDELAQASINADKIVNF